MNNSAAHTQLVADALVALTELPCTMAWKAHSFLGVTALRRVMRANVEGIADIICCSRGRFFAIEAKTGLGKQNPDQVRFQNSVENSGGIYVIVRSVQDAVNAVS